jgi:hypothetical protein
MSKIRSLVRPRAELRASHVSDQLKDTPAGFPQQMGNPAYDWTFKTVGLSKLKGSDRQPLICRLDAAEAP